MRLEAGVELRGPNFLGFGAFGGVSRGGGGGSKD